MKRILMLALGVLMFAGSVNAASLFASRDITAGTTTPAALTFTLPLNGIRLYGATSAIVTLQWKSLTGSFLVENVITTTYNDTLYTTFPLDTIRVDSAYVKQNATLETVTIPLVSLFCSGPMQGYYHIRITANGATDIENFVGSIEVK